MSGRFKKGKKRQSQNERGISPGSAQPAQTKHSDQHSTDKKLVTRIILQTKNQYNKNLNILVPFSQQNEKLGIDAAKDGAALLLLQQQQLKLKIFITKLNKYELLPPLLSDEINEANLHLEKELSLTQQKVNVSDKDHRWSRARDGIGISSTVLSVISVIYTLNALLQLKEIAEKKEPAATKADEIDKIQSLIKATIFTLVTAIIALSPSVTSMVQSAKKNPDIGLKEGYFSAWEAYSQEIEKISTKISSAETVIPSDVINDGVRADPNLPPLTDRVGICDNIAAAGVFSSLDDVEICEVSAESLPKVEKSKQPVATVLHK